MSPAAIEALFVDLFLEAHAQAAQSRSSSTSTPPTTRCTAIRKAGSSTAITIATAICRSMCSAAGICWRPSCRPSNIDGSAGSVEEVARIVAQIRARWPRTRILLRADSGFAREALMAWCEAEPGRLRVRPRPQRAARRGDRRRTPAGRGGGVRDRQARPPLQGLPLCDARQLVAPAPGDRPRRNGPRARPTRASSSPRLSKAETNGRFLYEKVYCARGEMENRIKECQGDLFADRTSTATMRANQLQALARLVRLCSPVRGQAHRPRPHAVRRKRPAARSGSSSSSSPGSSASARGASNSPSPRPVPTPTNGACAAARLA